MLTKDNYNYLNTTSKTVLGAINEVNGKVNDITIPTKTSELTNDSGYVTDEELDEKGYLTEHQDLSAYQTKEDETLETTSKDIVGAINEINAKSITIEDDCEGIITIC